MIKRYVAVGVRGAGAVRGAVCGALHIPAGYPIQKNILEFFPQGLWEITLPAAALERRHVAFVVAAFGADHSQTRGEITASW